MAASSRILWLAFLAAYAAACGNTNAGTSRPEAQGEPVEPKTGNSEVNPASQTVQTSMGTLKISPIWHGTLAFEIGGTVIVVDPWSKAPPERLPKADLVLVTDIHQDHFDQSAIAQVLKSDGIVVAPQVVVEKLPSAEPLANGEEVTKHGIRILAVPMYNTQRGPEEGKLYHDKGRGNGYVLSFGETRIYISGDTECTSEMRSLSSIDLAFVCMNLPYTMPPEEAAECIKAFRPKTIIPYHYRGSDLGVLEQALEGEAGIELRLMDFYLPAS